MREKYFIHFAFPPEPMRTQSQGDSSDDFIIDRPKCVIQQKPKGTSRAVRTPQQPQQSRNLQKAANAPGQKKSKRLLLPGPNGH